MMNFVLASPGAAAAPMAAGTAVQPVFAGLFSPQAEGLHPSHGVGQISPSASAVFAAVSAAVATAVVGAARVRTARRPRARFGRTLVALASEDAEASSRPRTSDGARAALAAQRLRTAANGLRRWGYVAEVSYTWLGLISLGVTVFASYARGGVTAYRNPCMALGLGSVGVSLMCAFVGWFQARTCRAQGRRCDQAANSLEMNAGGSASVPLAAPSVAEIEMNIRHRHRTAWLGTFSAVFGLQAMVGLLVTKVLVASGTVSPAPGVSLDVFTLLAVTNSALSHVIGGGAASTQQGALPPCPSSQDDQFRGWGSS
mmetsp:Transcript_29635/g.94957  ORF Transcript_29635/g.94957 Transcript_29635/m.94957 type:complete len:314 (+) Transcript_29635:114-1055(+)